MTKFSYFKVCDEWDAFDKEFVPQNNLALSRLFELAFFVGAASAMAEPDEDLFMRITSTQYLIEFDRLEYMKKNLEKL